jgi:aryl-alcohol dehydrogenase-like predicted oxidoreductase
VRHHLLHPVQVVVVADRLDQRRQRAVRLVRFAGASKPHHAEEAAAAMRVKLSPDEGQRLTDLSSEVKG